MGEAAFWQPGVFYDLYFAAGLEAGARQQRAGTTCLSQGGVEVLYI